MKWRILVTAPNLLPVIDKYISHIERRGGSVITPQRAQERFSETELAPLVKDVHAIICGDDEYTKAVLSQAKQLRVISKWGTGIDSIDPVACAERGIVVCNVPNAFTAPVADTVLAFILSFARRLSEVNTTMHSGTWRKVPAQALHEATLGIIGFGNIGRAVARRAHAFGMRILAHDSAGIDGKIYQAYGVEPVLLNRLLSQSDYVSVNCDLNPTSIRLISEDALGQMKTGAYIINTARGPIIDEQALIRALQSGKIAGAGLDVFEGEPLPKTSPLLMMQSVLLSPHNANSSPTSYAYVHQQCIDNLFAALEGVSIMQP